MVLKKLLKLFFSLSFFFLFIKVLKSNNFQCWSSYKTSYAYRNPIRRPQFARTILISEQFSSLIESTEEDLETLQQFDNSFVNLIFHLI